MSKNTKYFGTIEEAKQYFPDGVPSNVIAIVGDGSQVLVSSDNAATNTQQYYNADLTNDEIVNTMVQDSYDEGHSDGYSEGETAGYESGYAEGVADGGANWLDVLYLDEKAKAESFLGISDWGLSDFYKYNFAKYATSEPYIDQQSALAFISGLQTNKTLWKLIKISKDADGNAVITYNQCSINFDGTNVGSFELDSNTYNNKICIWGTLTLAAGDEVIMDCATTITDPESGDVYALGLFGGFDDETNDPATFKCETAGTYTFGVWIDPPQVQDGEAACFVSTAFNYTGSATVPAIAVPTGEIVKEDDYFCLHAVHSDGSEIDGQTEFSTTDFDIYCSGFDSNSDVNGIPYILEYSLDKITWLPLDLRRGCSVTTNSGRNFNVYIRGINSNLAKLRIDVVQAGSDAHYVVSGNVLSLAYGENYSIYKDTATIILGSWDGGLFSNSQYLLDASNLVLPNKVTEQCYIMMFYGCSALKAGPKLLAENMIYQCYMSMFSECPSLTSLVCLANYMPTGNVAPDMMGDMLNSVSSTGVLYKNPLTNSSFFEYDDGGTTMSVIPSGWTIQDYAG